MYTGYAVSFCPGGFHQGTQAHILPNKHKLKNTHVYIYIYIRVRTSCNRLASSVSQNRSPGSKCTSFRLKARVCCVRKEKSKRPGLYLVIYIYNPTCRAIGVQSAIPPSLHMYIYVHHNLSLCAGRVVYIYILVASVASQVAAVDFCATPSQVTPHATWKHCEGASPLRQMF